MLTRSQLRKRLLKRLGLLMGAIAIGIVLSQTLNAPKTYLPEAPKSAENASSVATMLTTVASPLAVQNRHDRRLAHYATVSRSDGSFRRMLIDENAMAAIQPGDPLPDGTLIVMETWYSPDNLGTVFVKQKQGGEWQYGSFQPGQPNYQMSFESSCHRCHAPFPETDFTLTKPLLEAALKSQQVQTAFCDRAGRTPCAPANYFPAS